MNLDDKDLDILIHTGVCLEWLLKIPLESAENVVLSFIATLAERNNVSFKTIMKEMIQTVKDDGLYG